MKEKTHLSIFENKLITEEEFTKELEKVRSDLINEIYDGMSDKEKGSRSEKRIKRQIDKDVKTGKYSHLVTHDSIMEHVNLPPDDIEGWIKKVRTECLRML